MTALNSLTPNAASLRQPALFLGHGAPMLALQDDGPYAEALQRFATVKPKPHAIVIVSAHWTTVGPIQITSGPRPGIIHDFAGFPRELYEVDYPAAGEPELAKKIVQLLQQNNIEASLNAQQPFDHGAWIPLLLMYPKADIPIVQVSLSAFQDPVHTLRLGKALSSLRDQGILLVGSGGIVHNLEKLKWHQINGPAENWALSFETWVKSNMERGGVEALLQFEDLAPHAAEAQPTSEHFYPLFFTLGAARADDKLTTIFEGFQYTSLSLLSIALDS